MSAALEQEVTSINASLRLTAQGTRYVLDFGQLAVTCPLTSDFPGMLRACADHLELAVKQTPAAYLAIGSDTRISRATPAQEKKNGRTTESTSG